jgi:TP53 regulating kinase and related kinases
MMMKEIARGAEAVIFENEGGHIAKKRVPKKYRLSEIDEKLRARRTRSEAKLMRDARRAQVLVPQIESEGKFEIVMEKIAGRKVRDLPDQEMLKLCQKIGASIGKMHSFGIIHGDLTTSNMIEKGDQIYFIDFGLGFHSEKIEDKAVDLRLLLQALESTHFRIAQKAWKIILKAYQSNCCDADRTAIVMSSIEKRGRYSKR